MSCSSSRTVTPTADVTAVGDDDYELRQLETMMAEKAADIFQLCDRDGKGLLTKSDMRRLTAELPLSAEQLEDVFDSLDVARNGFLTSVEFANGFGKFLGLSCNPSVDPSKLQLLVYETETDRRNSLDDVIIDDMGDDEAFEEFLRNLGACGLLDDDVAIKSMWVRLRHDTDRPELLEDFEDLLRRLTSELSRSQMDYNALKSKYRQNDCAHDEEIGVLYEEMEAKINTEKQRMRNEEKLKERRLKAEMEKELEEKDRRLNELLAREKELERTLVELNAKEIRIKQENLKLQKEKEEIEERLSNLTADRLAETAQIQSQSQVDKEIRSAAAVQIAQWLELERENLIRQLNVLRTTNQRLSDIQDERSFHSPPPGVAEMLNSSTSTNLSQQNSANYQFCEDDVSANYDAVDAMSESQQSGLSSEDLNTQEQFADDNSERQQPIGATSTADDQVDKSSLKSTYGQTRNARLFKIVFVGDSGVGKSSFIHRFCSHTFRPSFSATIGVDFQVKNVEVDGQQISLQLWDTAGQERFRTFTKQYFRKADGILIMYDVTDLQSFKSVREWMNSIQESAEEGTVLVLLGNKTDLIEEDKVRRVVSEEDGDNLALEYDALFYETSAKSGKNIQQSVEAMTRLLTEREDNEMERSLQLVTTLESSQSVNNNSNPRKFCCS